MKKSEFRKFLQRHLLPVFPGTDLGANLPATSRQQVVASKGPAKLLIKPAKNETFKVELARSQPFLLEERRLVELFIGAFASARDSIPAEHLDDVLAATPRRVISEFLLPGHSRTLQHCISSFEDLASQTYEGHQVVSSIGVTGSLNHGVITLADLWKDDFSRVLANGIDSLFVCGRDGKVFNVAYVKTTTSKVLAPYRLSAIANWTDNASAKKVALVLNRNGEVLVFKAGRLQFAKRRGSWIYYPHDSFIKKLGTGNNRSLRQAIYESCLDISFGRTGGYLAWADQGSDTKIKAMAKKNDVLSQKRRTKTKLLSKTINRNFQSLDRRLRQEILAMDGATILSHRGEVLATGAIVKVSGGGDDGGGRRAAALALSEFGIGIKISSDGPISAFQNLQPLFSL